MTEPRTKAAKFCPDCGQPTLPKGVKKRPNEYDHASGCPHGTKSREHPTCRHPDRDSPKLLCGYPLPCPWHTAIIDASKDPPTVTIPVTSDAMKSPVRERLGQIGRAVRRG